MRIARCFLVVVAVAVLVLTIASAAFCQWVQVGLDGYDVRGIAFRAEDRDSAYASVYYNDKGIDQSTDDGLNWTPVGSLPWAFDLAVDPVDKDVIYAICWPSVYRSTDAGINWDQKDDGLAFHSDYGPADIAVKPCSPDVVYVTTSAYTGGGKLYSSPDQGDTWDEVAMPWPQSKGALAIDPVNCARMYVTVRSPGFIARTLNNGSTWTSVFSGDVDDISIDPQDTDIVFAAADGEVHRSPDGGDNWDSFDSSDGLTDYIRVVEVNPVNPAVVYAAGGTSVFRSTDGGFSWSDYSDGLPEGTFVNSIAVEGETGEVVLLGTYQEGIYRRSTSLAGVEPEHNEDVAFLLSTSPNPFRSETTISYQIPRAGPTFIAVYDVSGREILTLVDRNEAAGQHELSWNGRDRSGSQVGPGIYFVRARSGQASAVKAIVLFR